MTLVAFTFCGLRSPVAGSILAAWPLSRVVDVTSSGVFFTTPGAHSRATSPATNKNPPSPNNTGTIFRISVPPRTSVAVR